MKKKAFCNIISICRPMPNIDHLMQEWPTQFEELIKEVHLFLILKSNPIIDSIFLGICSACRSWYWSRNLYWYCLLYTLKTSLVIIVILAFFSLALLDIPVYESRIQSLHALFTLYLGFKNSEVKKKKHLTRNNFLFVFFLAFQSDVRLERTCQSSYNDWSIDNRLASLSVWINYRHLSQITCHFIKFHLISNKKS